MRNLPICYTECPVICLSYAAAADAAAFKFRNELLIVVELWQQQRRRRQLEKL